MILTTEVLAAAGVLLFIAIVVMGLMIIRQRRQLNELQRPRYGFLGKPLYSFAAMLIIVGGFGVTFYSVFQNQGGTQVSADKNILVRIEYKQVSIIGNTGRYKFNFIPNVDNVDWGKDKELFEVAWKITNLATNEVKIATESNLSNIKPGGLVYDLPRGRYKVEALTTYQNKNWIASNQFSF
jgi:hypothetical protein